MVSTLEKVKQAAFSLFARQGYEFTTMNQIATAVGIKKPSLYAHFESKEALFLAVFTDMEQAYQKHMRQVFSDTGQYYSTEAKLYLFEQYIAYFALRPGTFSTMEPHSAVSSGSAEEVHYPYRSA